MSNLSFAGAPEVSPTTFIINLSKFIPGGYSILYYGCLLIGLLICSNAIIRQIDTAKGRGEFKASQNFMHFFFGAGLAVLAEYIGYVGKGVFGEFQDVSVLLYAAQEQASLSRVAVTAFLYLLQFLGSVSIIVGWRQANVLTSGRARPDQTWVGVFWFFAGGLGLVFIQYTIGLAGAILGIPFADFINNL